MGFVAYKFQSHNMSLTEVIILPTQTRHYKTGEILQNYLTFALFDPQS